MIVRLSGKLVEREPHRLVVDVHGVGYEVLVPLTTYTAMPEAGVQVSIDVHTHVREDVIALYGFSSKLEKKIFERLIAVSGIGPRLAVTILSGRPVQDLVTSIRNADLPRLTSIPGVGKKTAERIVIELKDKLQEFSVDAAKPAVETDVLSALENLGYPPALAEGAFRRATDGAAEESFEVLFKRTLQILTKG